MLAGLVAVALLFSIVMLKDEWNKQEEKRKKVDKNIEWYGPDIYLKDKDYGHYDDDFREELIDKDKYIDKENRRQKNVRNKSSNSSTNTIDAIGFNYHNPENENKRT